MVTMESSTDSVGTSICGSPEVLLAFPGKYGAPDPQVPLQLLHVAAALRERGYGVRVHDMRLHDSAAFAIGRPVFVGITSMSGPQIRFGLEFARRVRTESPGCPIVWGGVHPTLLPEQTAASDCVDVVVRGEGELVVADLADRLASGAPLRDVDGLTYQADGAIVSTPDAEVIDLDLIPMELPLDLLELDRYPTLQAGRTHIQTSRGCPHRCGFCYNTIFNKRAWRGKSPERILDEFEYVLRRFPQTKIVDPVDDNFFVDRRRAEAVCEGILSRGIKIAWRANCRFDYLATYDREFVSLLERAGCVELDFGGESGSIAMQEAVCKDVTAEQILTSVENLHKWAPSIDPFVSWLSGLPGETYADMEKTFDLMDEMGRANPRTQHYGIFLYTPFPSPLLGSLPPEFEPPRSLEEWGDIEVFHFQPPWHAKEYVEKLRTISAVTRWAFYPQSRIDEHGPAFRAAYGLVNSDARYRWKHRNFSFPVELRAANAAARRLRGFL
jgi:anaerobic magnesium-protoporphyrin IX monomethyl ester cyclase